MLGPPSGGLQRFWAIGIPSDDSDRRHGSTAYLAPITRMRKVSPTMGFPGGPEFDFGHLGPDHAAWQRAYAMPWRSWIGSFRMFDLVRDMEKP